MYLNQNIMKDHNKVKTLSCMKGYNEFSLKFSCFMFLKFQYIKINRTHVTGIIRPK